MLLLVLLADRFSALEVALLVEPDDEVLFDEDDVWLELPDDAPLAELEPLGELFALVDPELSLPEFLETSDGVSTDVSRLSSDELLLLELSED